MNLTAEWTTLLNIFTVENIDYLIDLVKENISYNEYCLEKLDNFDDLICDDEDDEEITLDDWNEYNKRCLKHVSKIEYGKKMLHQLQMLNSKVKEITSAEK